MADIIRVGLLDTACYTSVTLVYTYFLLILGSDGRDKLLYFAYLLQYFV